MISPLLLLLTLLLTTPLVAQDIKYSLFRIASTEYATLTETSIKTFARFDFAAWEAMLADNSEYDFPDGDQNTRTKLIGKAKVLGW